MRDSLVNLHYRLPREGWRFGFVVLGDADGEPVIGLRVDTVMDRMLLHQTSRPRRDFDEQNDAGWWTGPIGRAGRRKPE